MTNVEFDPNVAPTSDVEDIITETNPNTGFLERVRSKSRVIGAVAGTLAFAGAGFGELAASSARASTDAPAAYAGLLDGSPVAAGQDLSTKNIQGLSAAEEEFIKLCRDSVTGDSVDGAGYEPTNSAGNKIKWNIDFVPIDKKCFKYGKQIVKVFAAAYPLNRITKHPDRLGPNLTFVNPSGKRIQRKQTLNRPLPAPGHLRASDVEIMRWQPNKGYGQPKQITHYEAGLAPGY
jgi:hypothetical protein